MVAQLTLSKQAGALPQWFHIFAVPFVLVGLGILARRLGRRDGDNAPQLNDLAAGTSVLLMSFGAVAADLRSLHDAAGLAALLGWLLSFVFVTFLSIDHDRYRS